MNNDNHEKKQFLYQVESVKDIVNPDKVVLRILTKDRKKHLTRLAIFFTKLGNGQVWLLFCWAVFLYSVPVGVTFQAAILLQLYIQVFLKNIFKRSRPYQKFVDLEVLYTPPDPYSFPSGHTCAAFTMAFTSYMVLPSFWPIFFIVALTIAYSRIYLAAHYPTDVVAGIIIAYVSSKTALIFTTLVTGFGL